MSAEQLKDILETIVELDDLRLKLLGDATALCDYKIGSTVSVDGVRCTIKHVHANVQGGTLAAQRRRLTVAMVVAPILSSGKESTRRLPYSAVLVEQWAAMGAVPHEVPATSHKGAGAHWRRRASDK